jgi:hypothetical protein
MEKNEAADARQRKNYPGDVRRPGTKDYAVILANLINYRNQLEMNKDSKQSVELVLKIAEKLQELGFKRQSNTVKNVIKRKVNITYKDRHDKFERLDQKRSEVIGIISECWKLGKEKHDEARMQQKEASL